MSNNNTKLAKKEPSKKPNFFRAIGNFFKRIGLYFKGVWGEVRKLSWLTGKDLVNACLTVLVFVAFFSIIIGLLDLAFDAGMIALNTLGQ
ncbi:MAG: preprotein translocase subunit SecE [Clostridia bacterium]|nr:preprotein translocase subunit SecE [Clostridia bacterium]